MSVSDTRIDKYQYFVIASSIFEREEGRGLRSGISIITLIFPVFRLYAVELIHVQHYSNDILRQLIRKHLQETSPKTMNLKNLFPPFLIHCSTFSSSLRQR